MMVININIHNEYSMCVYTCLWIEYRFIHAIDCVSEKEEKKRPKNAVPFKKTSRECI